MRKFFLHLFPKNGIHFRLMEAFGFSQQVEPRVFDSPEIWALQLDTGKRGVLKVGFL